ncbi:MAG: DNA replication/repair protein RecF, partial [Bacillota bacterium]
VKDKELIRFGEEYGGVSTISENEDGENTTEIVIRNDGRKGIKKDGIKVKKASELLDRIYMIIFSPEDLRIVKDEPEKRRKFINRELCQIRAGYLFDLNEYNKVLKQRNTYLKEENIDGDLLDIWDRQLAACGTRIIRKRKQFIEKIDEISRDIHFGITDGAERLELKYEASIAPTDNLEEDFYEILAATREDDVRNGTTGKGPHRDDFRISADGIDLRRFGSQGQQRTAALSLKLSEIKIIEEEKGEKPVLLLDDVLSELDNDRQIMLIRSLGENQMFITTTEIMESVADRLPKGKYFKIMEGQVSTEI